MSRSRTARLPSVAGRRCGTPVVSGAADPDVPGDMAGSLLAFPSGASVLSSPGCGGGDEIQSVKTEWGVVRERP